MKKIISIIATIVILTINNSCIQAQKNSSDKQILLMLKEFYSAYITEMSIGNPYTFKYKLDSIKKNYCTIKLIKELPILSKKADADPLLNAQDSNIDCLKTLTIEKDKKKQNQYIVSYTDIYSKTRFIVKLFVVKENGCYKINSIL